MPKPFDIGELELPEGDEIGAFIAAHPSIAPERFADEEMLIHGGAKTDDIFLLVQGACIVESADAPEPRRAGDALAVLQATPDAPVFVGEMAYLGQHPRSAGVRSVMSTCALRLHPPHLDAIMESYPGLTRILCRQFSHRLRDANEQLHALRARMALHPEQRIFEAGETLCERDTAADTLYQIIEGAVEYGDAGEKLRPEPGKPCFVEARAFLNQGSYGETYRCKGLVIVLAHPASSRAAIVRNYPELLLALLDG